MVSQKLTMEDILQLREQWIEEFKDLCGEIPLSLPPLRLVNHEIRLIDPDKQYHYHLPKCADHYKEQLLKKIKQYTTAGWWVPPQCGKLHRCSACRKRLLESYRLSWI
jgi:hypothetical protein